MKKEERNPPSRKARVAISPISFLIVGIVLALVMGGAVFAAYEYGTSQTIPVRIVAADAYNVADFTPLSKSLGTVDFKAVSLDGRTISFLDAKNATVATVTAESDKPLVIALSPVGQASLSNASITITGRTVVVPANVTLSVPSGTVRVTYQGGMTVHTPAAEVHFSKAWLVITYGAQGISTTWGSTA